MELRISQDWIDRRPASEASVEAGPMMALHEMDAHAENLLREFTQQPPAIEIRRRGWLAPFSEAVAEASIDSIYEAFSNLLAQQPPTPARQIMFRQTSSATQQDLWKNLSTKFWLTHVAGDAIEKDIANFQPEILNEESISELVRLSRFEDGPVRALNLLERSGIHVEVRNPLPSMRLDGAALMLQDDRPLIALTLRFDRVDNFWFTLLHELGHVKRHILGDRNLAFLDDLEKREDIEEFEAEADAFARNSVVPKDVWRRSEARRLGTKSAILKLAEQLHISPAILAGRLRFERQEFTLFPDMLGQDEVRKQLIV